MKLIKIRFTWQLHELFDEDFTPAKSPITEILKQGDPVVFDTSLEPANLHRFTRTHKFPLPVFKFLEECCEVAGVSSDIIHWITPIEKYRWKNKHVFNGTLEEYHNSRTTDVDFVTEIDKHFLALNNCPKTHRLEIVEYLEKTGINSQAYYSYNPKNIFPDHERSIKLDHSFADSSPKNILSELDSLPAQIWQSSFMSIVTESLYNASEHVIFPTEKSWKAFDKFHLPIFVSVPGFVDHIRSLGFDVFDDFIDHSYDKITDDKRRMAEIKSVIDTWSQMSLQELSAIKVKLEPRLRKNRDVLHELTLASIKHRDEFLRSFS